MFSVLDATAKIPSGILHGNGIQLGSFDQCLGSRARVQLDTGSIVKVYGKYCLARVDLKSEHKEMEIPVHLAQAKNLIKSRIDDVSMIFIQSILRGYFVRLKDYLCSYNDSFSQVTLFRASPR